MAQTVRMPDAPRTFEFDELLGYVQETLDLAKRNLPRDHALTHCLTETHERMAALFESAGSTLEDMEELIEEFGTKETEVGSIIEVLEDWKRGIADWSDMEQLIREMRPS